MKGLSLTALICGTLALCLSCMPGLGPRSIEGAPAGSIVSWSAVSLESTRGNRGEAIDTISVQPGDLLRLEVATDTSVTLAERSATPSGYVETWFSAQPNQGVVIVRSSITANAIAAPKGVIEQVWRGHAFDPGYGWFALEARALAWAKTPLGTVFPQLARGGRLDESRFSKLDAVLKSGVAQSADPQNALQSADALRRVLALRAVRELRPLSGLPYFYIEDPIVTGALPFSVSGQKARPSYRVAAGRPVTLSVDGPGLLQLSPTAANTAVGSVELQISEHNQERGRTSSLGRRPAPHRSLPRLRVHVPPGHHDYTLNASAPLDLATVFARPAVHFEDVSDKSEEDLLKLAQRSCQKPTSPTLCAITLALLGRDDDPAFDTASPSVREFAAALSRGSSESPLLTQAERAERGDSGALAAVSQLAAQSIDRTVSRSWDRVVEHGSAWAVASSEKGESTWITMLSDPSKPECDKPGTDWDELSDQARDIATTLWHGAPTLDLLVASSCSETAPIEINVDGQRLLANPSAPLVHWHIRTQGTGAHVVRLDRGRAHVYVQKIDNGACPTKLAKIRAPHPVDSQSIISFDPSPLTSGMEIWLREGAKVADLRIGSASSTNSNRTLRIVAPSVPSGFSAIDNDGTRWMRVAKIGLPAWASQGVRIDAGPEVAVRALVRTTRPEQEQSLPDATESPTPFVELDEAALTALSKQIQEAPPSEAGALYLQRSLMLARGGAARGAGVDARAAQKLGAHGPAGELPQALVSAALQRRPLLPAPLPDGTKAFGIEPDFDDGAARCTLGSGPRAIFSSLWEQSKLATSAISAAPEAHFDASLAARTLQAVADNRADPRAATLEARSLAGSRYKQINKGTTSPLLRHEKSVDETPRQPVDAWGELRPSVASGGVLEEGTFVVATASKPAKASLTRLPVGTQLKIELACYAKEPALATEACSAAVAVGTNPPLRATLQGGVQQIPIAIGMARQAQLGVTVPESPARWVVLVRLVFDRQTPGAQQIPQVGWVLAPKPHEYRFAIDPTRPLTLDAVKTKIIRLDVNAESGKPQVFAEFGGQTRALPVDGTSEVLVIPPNAQLRVSVLGGTASVAAFERAPLEGDEIRPGRLATAHQSAPRATAQPAQVAMGFGTPADRSTWLDDAEQSPEPLSALQAALGTVEVQAGATVSNARPGVAVGDTAAYSFANVNYRRRIEAIDLWTNAGVFARFHAHEPAVGAEASLYWDLATIHTRVAAAGNVQTQRVAGVPARTWALRGFAEYSLRVASDVFILPRLGVDTVDVSLRFRPSSLVEADDEIYNPYRAQRPTFLFAQGLLWYAPHFDDIFYLRLRGTEDAKSKVFSHASARPGAFAVLGDLDVSSYFDLTWYSAADSLNGAAHTRETIGFSAAYDFWFALGSVDIAPGISALGRPEDGAYEVSAFITLLGSYRRGLRDFSSLELDFPEQRSGGVPWRGPSQSYP